MFWYEPQKKWVLVTVFADERLARFYESKDLETWKFLSEFGPAGTADGQWECPDLVELPVEGTSQKKWVLIISRNPGAPQGGTGVQYFAGNFDGTKFTNETPDSQKMWVDYGKDFYATQRFANLPARDKRIIWMGWLGNWQYANKEPTSPWRGVQSIPREMFLRKCEQGYCLDQRPVRELQSLREKPQTLDFDLRRRIVPQVPVATSSFELEGEMISDKDARLTLTDEKGSIIAIGFDPVAKQVYIDRTKSAEANFSPDFPGKHAGSITAAENVKLHVFVDQTTLEVFANDGERVLTDRVYLSGPIKIGLGSDSPAKARFQLWPMRSIWH